jgi:hypothetical protein
MAIAKRNQVQLSVVIRNKFDFGTQKGFDSSKEPQMTIERRRDASRSFPIGLHAEATARNVGAAKFPW